MAHELPVKEYAKHMRTMNRWHSVASASGMGEHKSLEIAVGRKQYRVVVNRRVIYSGQSAGKAVAIYNDGRRPKS